MTWLVTGGAGYIGSHVVQAFLDAGMTAVVLDDLSSGRREFVPEGVPLVVGSITAVAFRCPAVVEITRCVSSGRTASRRNLLTISSSPREMKAPTSSRIFMIQ